MTSHGAGGCLEACRPASFASRSCPEDGRQANEGSYARDTEGPVCIEDVGSAGGCLPLKLK